MNHKTAPHPAVRALACALAATAALALLVAPAAAAPPLPGAAAGPARIVPGSQQAEAHRLTTLKSSNWSGYVDIPDTLGGTFSEVSATWTVPKLKCNAATAGGYASFWVGLDGFNDSTVEQDGTRAICENAKTAEYVDWYEMYPAGVNSEHSTLKAGDQITGSVTVTGTKYTLAITDHTHPSDSFSVTQTCAKSTCTDASADWIVESHVVTNGIPFPDYGTLTFTKASTIAGKKTGTISSFYHYAVIAVDASGKTNASVSKLTDKGTTFSDIWHRSQ